MQQIRGEADAKAAEIYARAYTQNPQAAEFYAFLKTLETYHKIFTKNSTLVLKRTSENGRSRQGSKICQKIFEPFVGNKRSKYIVISATTADRVR